MSALGTKPKVSNERRADIGLSDLTRWSSLQGSWPCTVGIIWCWLSDFFWRSKAYILYVITVSEYIIRTTRLLRGIAWNTSSARVSELAHRHDESPQVAPTKQFTRARNRIRQRKRENGAQISKWMHRQVIWPSLINKPIQQTRKQREQLIKNAEHTTTTRENRVNLE